MTIIESLAPAQKTFLGFLAEQAGLRPNARTLYAVGPDGSQRVLIPSGKDRYDRYVFMHVAELTGRETDQDLRTLAAQVPHVNLERVAPWQIENTTYIYLVDRFSCKFMAARTRRMGAHVMMRYWFFAQKLGEDQIMYRVRRLISMNLESRARKIEEACAHRHVVPYGPVAALVEAFHQAARLLDRFSRDLIVRSTGSRENGVSAGLAIGQAARAAAAVVLQIVQDNLIKLYEPVRTLLSIEYPEMCGPPAPPALRG